MKSIPLILVLSIYITIAAAEGDEHIPQSPRDDSRFELREEESIPHPGPKQRGNDVDIGDIEKELSELGLQMVLNDKRDNAPPIPSHDQQRQFFKKKRKMRDDKKKQKAAEMRKNKNKNSERKVRKLIKQKRETEQPQSYGINLENEWFAATHPNGHLRPGFPTSVVNCDTVSTVTSDMRNANIMFLPVHPHYTKYTDVYGIYIIGSDDVNDASLKRACYVVKTLFASRFDILLAFYLLYGRVALIGDHEYLTSLPEYGNMPASINSRARGLGSTIPIPMVSAGDDNMACKPYDIYWDQDIMVHELAHGVHQMGASYVIPGFELRLREVFEQSVLIDNKWANTYAATNPEEYFAVCTQFYFNSYHGSSYFHLGVHGRESMRQYDPDITALLDEVYPCAALDEHMLIDRCHWKNCSTGSNFNLLYPETVQAKSLCPELHTSSSASSADECAQLTCEYDGNAFNWKGTKCKVLKCAEPILENNNMMLVQGQGSYNIFYGFQIPEMTVDEINQDQLDRCFIGPSDTSYCDNIDVKQPYGGLSKKKCRQRGGCWDSTDSICYYSKRQMADRSIYCIDSAKAGKCDENPNFMYYFCPVACGVADRMDQLPPEEELKSRCGDFNFHCDYWVDAGICDTNPSYMNANCPMSCVSHCTPTNPLTGQ